VSGRGGLAVDLCGRNSEVEFELVTPIQREPIRLASRSDRVEYRLDFCARPAGHHHMALNVIIPRHAYSNSSPVIPLAEYAKHVGDEENQQYCPQSYTSPAAGTPAGMAVVPSTGAKNQQQDDDKYQHFRSSPLLNRTPRPARLEAGASARSRTGSGGLFPSEASVPRCLSCRRDLELRGPSFHQHRDRFALARRPAPAGPGRG